MKKVSKAKNRQARLSEQHYHTVQDRHDAFEMTAREYRRAFERLIARANKKED